MLAGIGEILQVTTPTASPAFHDSEHGVGVEVGLPRFMRPVRVGMRTGLASSDLGVRAAGGPAAPGLVIAASA